MIWSLYDLKYGDACVGFCAQELIDIQHKTQNFFTANQSVF
jgi:hypothetical protein